MGIGRELHRLENPIGQGQVLTKVSCLLLQSSQAQSLTDPLQIATATVLLSSAVNTLVKVSMADLYVRRFFATLLSQQYSMF